MNPWLSFPCRSPCLKAASRAAARNEQLTKPQGALGQLEALVIRLASLQGRPEPAIESPWISLFAGDHGVAAEGVSAYPQSVTGEMLRNFTHGGAAISVLAKRLDAPLEVIDLGTLGDLELPGVRHLRLGPGTASFLEAPAMTEAQLAAALDAGYESVERALTAGADLFLAGEMGIGNTTAATAMACSLLQKPAPELTGAGTGLQPAGIARKSAIITRALERHRLDPAVPLEILRHLGGFEIAALCGAYLHCAQRGLPVLVDGFICSVAALCAVRFNPSAHDWLIFAHHSAEPGHRAVLAALGAKPLLDLGLRLGEGSGAALAVPLLQQACALHKGMATFAEAAVSGQDS
ncbi:nicotinate-nucleotide--dimethylbenzimidazole phosphoribosyltransferase [Stutzerimonas tarimensis]|uniref:Nicotinate-nucleotide--dimethylbenzimidazole phosphoribosyltransferase n=1 Tax=Stutzerimonas tarimensis TaxID=1507735 RepID=A0ABV7TAR0_9GAMM